MAIRSTSVRLQAPSPALRHLARADRRGFVAIEYALIGAVVITAVISAFSNYGTALSGATASVLASAGASASAGATSTGGTSTGSTSTATSSGSTTSGSGWGGSGTRDRED